MEGSEELREALVTLRRENDLLRVETTHANLLLKALDAVLCVDGGDDPFAGVFSALMPVFDCSHAIVLIEPKNETTVKKFAKQHLTTDTGIEIKIPMEQYNSTDNIEFMTNEDGTISVLIKNIGHITSK